MNQSNPKHLAQALLEEAGDALFLFDPDSDQLYEVSRMAVELTGFSREEMLVRPATYFFRFGGKGGQQRLREAASRTGVFHGQDGFFLRTRQDGVWVPVSLTVSRLHVQPRTLALMTARDVREQHEAHGRLAQMEGELRRVMASVSDCLWSGECSGDNLWVYRYFSPVVETPEPCASIYRSTIYHFVAVDGLPKKLKDRFIANTVTAVISATAETGSHDHAE